MKLRIHSLRTQKMALDSRLTEMQSTIASLKDEQRALETAIEEKQTEMKMLREKEESSSKKNSQIMALTELLKQKEIEIQDLKQHLDPIKVRSVSTDDPSNPQVNLSDGNLEGNSKNEISDTINGENSMKIGNVTENEAEINGEEKLNGVENSQVESDTQGMGSRISSERNLEKLSKNSEEGEKAGTEGILKEGMRARLRGKHGSVSKSRGKKWRIIARNRGTVVNGKTENYRATNTNSGIFSKDTAESGQLEKKGDKANDESNKEKGELEISEKLKQGEDFSVKIDHENEGKGSEAESTEKEGEMVRNQDVNSDGNHQHVGEEEEMNSKHGNLEKPRTSVGGKSELIDVTENVEKQKSTDGLRRPEQTERVINEVDSEAEVAKVEDGDEQEDTHEPQIYRHDSDTLEETTSKLEEDNYEE